jgi:hypothetical protein
MHHIHTAHSHPSPVAKVLVRSVGKTYLESEPKIEPGPALQQTDALPTEQSFTLLRYATPLLSLQQANVLPAEQRRTLLR